jgi:hypothetical protein
MIWQSIKSHMTQNHRHGSIGYSIAVADAAQIFVLVANELKHEDKQKAEFNADAEVASALCCTGLTRKLALHQ